ncbi:MAG: hypothetical protein KDD55_07475 [Bdellovibrionales bacterium]|nr:hypothetical protein [Bdellovibrionales bacterium]
MNDVRRYKTYQQKLTAAADLYWGARKLKEAYFRSTHPDWSEAKIQKAVKEWMLYAKS